MVNMPPMPLATPIATISGHDLQIKGCTQVLGGDRVGDDAAIAVIKDAGAGDIGRFVPKAAQAFEIAKEIVQ